MPSSRPSPPRLLPVAILASASLAAVTAIAPGASAAPADEGQQRAIAEALFQQGQARLDANDFDQACPKFVEVVRLQPGKAGALVKLGECYERAGKLASAHITYAEAERAARATWESAVTSADKATAASREKQAHDKVAELAPLIPMLILAVPTPSRIAGLVVKRDDDIVGAGQWDVPVPMNPGRHTVRAELQGRLVWTHDVVLAAGQAPLRLEVDIPAAELAPPATAPPVIAPAAPPTDAAPSLATLGVGQPSKPSLSHRHQFGAFYRGDIELVGMGYTSALGLSYGLADFVDVDLCALLSGDKGFEPGATFYVLQGALKPTVEVAVPVLVVGDLVEVGIRAGVGGQWDVTHNLGVFAHVSATVFPGAPGLYGKFAVLPGAGIQGRL